MYYNPYELVFLYFFPSIVYVSSWCLALWDHTWVMHLISPNNILQKKNISVTTTT